MSLLNFFQYVVVIIMTFIHTVVLVVPFIENRDKSNDGLLSTLYGFILGLGYVLLFYLFVTVKDCKW